MQSKYYPWYSVRCFVQCFDEWKRIFTLARVLTNILCWSAAENTNANARIVRHFIRFAGSLLPTPSPGQLRADIAAQSRPRAADYGSPRQGASEWERLNRSLQMPSCALTSIRSLSAVTRATHKSTRVTLKSSRFAPLRSKQSVVIPQHCTQFTLQSISSCILLSDQCTLLSYVTEWSRFAH